MRCSRRARRVHAVLLGAVSSLAVGLLSVPPAASAASVSSSVIAADVAAAATYGAANGVRDGVAVLDLRTGAYYAAGEATRLFASASVMKVMIAAKLVLTGQMHGSTAVLATSMIERSDDAAAEALWPQVGGPDLEPWIAQHYRIPFLGAPNSRAGYWGNTHITAKGMVYLYGALARDARVRPWLLPRMHNYDCHAADGTNQCFGLPAATRGAAIKQGWGAHSADNPSDAVVNTTGYVQHSRYAVAVLTEGQDNNSGTDWRGYNPAQADVVNRMARLLLPGGAVDPASRHNPTLVLGAASARGNTVTVTGWAADPDRGSRPVRITVLTGGHRVASGIADRRARGLTPPGSVGGRHGYAVTFTAPNGAHTYRVLVGNVGRGTHDATKRYRPVPVDGVAHGALDALHDRNGTTILTGWAADPDSAARSIHVEVRDGDTRLGRFPADLPSRRIDARHHLEGAHAYRIALPALADGIHALCVYALNTGPDLSPATPRLGCATVTTANDPIAASPSLQAAPGAITVSGDVYDPNLPHASTGVEVIVDDQPPSTVVADDASTEFDDLHSVTGAHGFTFTGEETAGTHTVRLRYLNLGAGVPVTTPPYEIDVPAQQTSQ